MGEYNFTIKYLPGKMYKLEDSLSWGPNFCSVGAVSGKEATVAERLSKGIFHRVDTRESKGQLLPSRLGSVSQEK